MRRAFPILRKVERLKTVANRLDYRHLNGYILKTLLVASFLELLLIRTLSRLWMHIPTDISQEDFVVYFFDLLTSFGSLMYYLSYIGVFLALFSVISYQLKSQKKLDRIASFLLVFLLIASLFLPFMNISLLFTLTYHSAFITEIFVLMAFCLPRKRRRSERTMVVLLALSFLCSYYFKSAHAVHQLFNISSNPHLVTEVFSIGEFIVVLNCLVVFLAYAGSPPGWKSSAILSSSLTILLITAYLINPYALSILSIWSLGFTLFLPFPLYAGALWLFAFTVIKCLWGGKYTGYGLAFIFFAGYTIPSSHQLLMAILGFSLVSLSDGLEFKAD